VATADGEFIARYSEKGLAELNFPVGRASREPLNHEVFLLNPPLAQHNDQGVESHSCRSRTQNVSAAGHDGNGFSKERLACDAKNLPGQNQKLRRNRGGNRQAKAVRAVGGACGANPVPVLVPCHRVLAANNKLGGFGGGLDWKRSLLKREGIEF